MIIFLLIVIVLVAWSLHLMQEAFNHREFSLMLAGTLVAISAAGIMVVYFLMNSCMGYVMNAAQASTAAENVVFVESLLGPADMDRPESLEFPGYAPQVDS